VSWQTCPLGDLVDIKGGGTPSRAIDAYWSGGIPWATVKDFKGSVILETEESISELGAKKSATNIISKGTIIIPTRMALGKVAIAGKDVAINQDLKALALKHNHAITTDFLFWFLRNSEEEFDRAGKGATVKGITVEFLKNVQVPLPPLATQKHIARVLEQADQLRKQAQQMESELNQLAQSLFLEMFGAPVKNPKGWVKVPISHFVEVFEGGKSVAAAGDESTASKFRVLKISAVTWREFNPSESKPLPEEYQPETSHFVRKGDLLFSRANTTELVGATSYVFEDYDNLLLPDKLWRFVWKKDVELSSMFIWNLFMDPSFRIELGKLSSGSGGSMKNISKGKLLPFEVIFPPSEMQKSFEKKFLKIRDEILACRRKAAECNAIFESLMQRAFNGELTAPERKTA